MSLGLGTGTAPQPASGTFQQEALAQKLKFESTLKNGAGWFVWVAGLSLVNSILSMSGSDWQFIFGLGISQIFDHLAKMGGTAGVVIGLFLNAIVAGVFVVFWIFARKGQRWAFIVGITLYTMDALLTLIAAFWLGLAFHAFALYGMWAGMNAISKLRGVEAEIARIQATLPTAEQTQV